MPIEPTAFCCVLAAKKPGSDTCMELSDVWAGLLVLLQQIVVFHLPQTTLLAT